MARRSTEHEENRYREELIELYSRQNKSIGEIGKILNLGESSIFQRLKRAGLSKSYKRYMYTIRIY